MKEDVLTTPAMSFIHEPVFGGNLEATVSRQCLSEIVGSRTQPMFSTNIEATALVVDFMQTVRKMTLMERSR